MSDRSRDNITPCAEEVLSENGVHCPQPTKWHVVSCFYFMYIYIIMKLFNERIFIADLDKCLMQITRKNIASCEGTSGKLEIKNEILLCDVLSTKFLLANIRNDISQTYLKTFCECS